MGRHWESWALRAALLGTVIYQLANGNTSGAVVAAEGFVTALLPLLIAWLSKVHVARPLEFAFVLGMALQYISESTKLFELFTYWDKIVHPTLIALTALVGTWLLLGYRDAFHKRVPMHLAALFGLLLGMCVGACWEFIEFGSDWFAAANLQKSNADTVSDILANDLGAFLAVLFATWTFCHKLTPNQRSEIGQTGRWLAHGPGRLFDRHGRLIGAILAVAFAAVIFLSQWIDRGTPALASDLAEGQGQSWTFSVDPHSADGTRVLSGDWLADERGMCRQNLEQPKPGSEKMGLLELAPDSVYGRNGRPFSVQASYFEERPSSSQGTEMDAGIAFGVRSEADFDLVEQSALHDFVRLDRYIHSKRRDIREELLRTRANEWHVLKVSVSGTTVTASVDGQTRFAVNNAADTDGGIALWARAAGATCFGTVQIAPDDTEGSSQ